VDDDRGVLAAYELDLADTYTLHLANSGSRALQLLGRHPIDFVILDLKLPGLNGIELLRRIRELKADLPVIVVTGHSSHHTAIDAANLGVAGYLTKPYEAEELAHKIEVALRWRQHRGADEPGPRTLAGTALRLVRQHAGAQPVRQVAQTLGVSLRELRGQFREEWGFSIKTYMARVRIEQALVRLRTTDDPIKAIAVDLGFHDASHFYREFRRLTRTTPGLYRGHARLP
jgi:two-component system response regulator YesN